MVENLNKLIGDIVNSAEQISAFSGKLAEDSDRTSNASILAGSIMKNAEKGSAQMEQMIAAVNEINQAKGKYF